LQFFNQILNGAKDEGEDHVLTLQYDYYSLAFYAFYLSDKELDQIKTQQEDEMYLET